MILRLHNAGVAWSVENPASSLMWLTDPFMELMSEIPELIAFSFHTCMFQAKRKKDTAIWTSVHELKLHLERKCDGQHEHLQWGRADTHNGFATAGECAYNEHMCASWAQAISDFAISQGFTPPPEDLQTATDGHKAISIRSTRLFWVACLGEEKSLHSLQTGWNLNFSTLMESLLFRHYLWENVFLMLQQLSHRAPSWYVVQMRLGVPLNQNPNNVLVMTMQMIIFLICPSLR